MRNNRKKTQCKLSAKSENNCLFFPSFFFFYTVLLHVLFFSALFLPKEEREVCIFPVSKHVSVRTQRSLKQLAFKRYSPMFTVIIRKWPCWTRARSSTSLCCWRLHPESEAKKGFNIQELCHFLSARRALFLRVHKNKDKTGRRW